MDSANRKSRLSPPLMYVFRMAHEAKDAKKKVDIRNEAGERVIAGRRLRERQVITEIGAAARGGARPGRAAEYDRDGVDDRYERRSPMSAKSILNFGIPDVTNRSIDEIGVDDIPEEIRTAIINYEPRLAAASLHIERDKSVDAAELKVRFIVRADLTCDPVHVPVEFIADVIETGKIVVNRL